MKTTVINRIAMKRQLRRILRQGQLVRVHGLATGTDGVTGTVAQMIDRGVPSDPITSDGFWTIVTDGGLRRDFQRRYLRVLSAEERKRHTEST